MGSQGTCNDGRRPRADDGEFERLVCLLARAAAVEYVRGVADGDLTPQMPVGEKS